MRIADVARESYENALAKGFYDDVNPDDVLHVIARASRSGCESAEVIDAVKKGLGESTKIPGFSCEEEEIADVLISLLDYAFWRGARVEEAVRAKMSFNSRRPRLHGGRA